MLTDEDRALGHRLAGAWLEQAGRGDAMALAEHFRRGGEPARAVRWYERAAAQALRANDLAAAIERAELGMASGAAGEAAGQLRLIQAEAHVWRGELDAARAAGARGGGARCRRAAPPGCAPGPGDHRRRQARAAGRRSSTGRAGRRDAVRARAGGAQRAGHLPGVGGELPRVRRAHGGRRRADRAHRGAGAASGRRASIRRRWALVHQVRAARASAAGDLGRCLGGLESALQAFEQAGDLRNACAVRTNLGYLYCELGDFQRAEAALRQALAASDRMGLYDLSAAVAAEPRPRARPRAASSPRRSGSSGRRSRTSAARAIRAGGRRADLPGRDPDRRAATTPAPSARRTPRSRRWRSRRRCRSRRWASASRARLGARRRRAGARGGARGARGAGAARRDRGGRVDGAPGVRRGAGRRRGATRRAPR